MSPKIERQKVCKNSTYSFLYMVCHLSLRIPHKELATECTRTRFLFALYVDFVYDHVNQDVDEYGLQVYPMPLSPTIILYSLTQFFLLV